MRVLSFQVLSVHKNDQGRSLAFFSNLYVTMVIKRKKKKKKEKSKKNSKTVSFLLEYHDLFPNRIDFPW